jgi:hypothetical protein
VQGLQRRAPSGTNWSAKEPMRDGVLVAWLPASYPFEHSF